MILKYYKMFFVFLQNGILIASFFVSQELEWKGVKRSEKVGYPDSDLGNPSKHGFLWKFSGIIGISHRPQTGKILYDHLRANRGFSGDGFHGLFFFLGDRLEKKKGKIRSAITLQNPVTHKRL